MEMESPIRSTFFSEALSGAGKSPQCVGGAGGGARVHGAGSAAQLRLEAAIEPTQQSALPPGSLPQLGPPHVPQLAAQQAVPATMPCAHVGSACARHTGRKRRRRRNSCCIVFEIWVDQTFAHGRSPETI
jgi:hypothetical protein